MLQQQSNYSLLQQNLAHSPVYKVGVNGDKVQKKESFYAKSANNRAKGLGTDSVIDYWKRHLLGVL